MRCRRVGLRFCLMSTYLVRTGILSLLLLATSCGRKPAELRRQALQAELQARQAFERHDAEAAAQAAEQAELASSRLQEQWRAGDNAEIQSCLSDARTAAQGARSFARRADEERQCRARLDSLKVGAYRKLRAWVYDYGLGGLAPVAERLGAAGAHPLPVLEQPLARCAGDLVELVEGRKGWTNSAVDWLWVAARLRAWQTNPPAELGLVLAPAFALHGLSDFALCEIEAIEPARLAATNTRALYHLERSLLYALEGWEETAEWELQAALALGPKGMNTVISTQGLAMVRLWLASNALRKDDQQQVQLQLASARRLWPSNPLLPLVESDSFACAGQRRRAAETLESSAPEDRWLANRFKRRAAELRNSQSAMAPLCSERSFLLEYSLRAAAGWLRDTAFCASLKKVLDAAKIFSEQAGQPAAPEVR
jgi:hypothetical protein